jgi:hypothetical protein
MNGRIIKTDFNAVVFRGWAIRKEQQSCHPRFDDKRFVRIEVDHNSFSDPPNPSDYQRKEASFQSLRGRLE